MTTTPLHSDPRGQANAIDREATGLHPHQLDREFVINGHQAGAANIWIDGYVDPISGRQLLRYTDDGSGMTAQQMRKHLGTLYSTGRSYDTNFGIGARVAALPRNHAGVDFASRLDGERLMRLHRSNGMYGVYNFDVNPNGPPQLTDLVEVEDELSRLPKRATTGTSVILRGNGKEDTWTPDRAHEIIRYLSERLFALDGTTIRVDTPDTGRANGMILRKIQPLGDRLPRCAEASGEIPFTLSTMTGRFRWWILPTDVMKRRTGMIYPVPAGVGLLCENEVLSLARTYSGDFGLIWKKERDRILILIEVDGAAMDTGRSALILPRYGKTIPWKKLGALFMENMPAEIDALLSASTINSDAFDAEMARLLDEDWAKKLRPQRGVVPAVGGTETVGDDGLELPDLVAGEENLSDVVNPDPLPNTPARTPSRQRAGTSPGKPRDVVIPPRVVFVDPDIEGPGFDVEFIEYVENANTVKVWKDAPPYVRDIDRWVEATGKPRAFVVMAVEFAYSMELAAQIIDANGQSEWGLTPDMIDQLKSSSALYSKLLGVQALERNIEAQLKSLGRMDG